MQLSGKSSMWGMGGVLEFNWVCRVKKACQKEEIRVKRSGVGVERSVSGMLMDDLIQTKHPHGEDRVIMFQANLHWQWIPYPSLASVMVVFPQDFLLIFLSYLSYPNKVNHPPFESFLNYCMVVLNYIEMGLNFAVNFLKQTRCKLIKLLSV